MDEEVLLARLGFYSGANFMKRDASCGTVLLTLGGAGTTVEKTVPHNVDLPRDFIPFYEVHCDIVANNTVWNGNRINSLTETSLGSSPAEPNLQTWVTDTTLTMQLQNFTSPTATGTRRIWWLVYKDYGTFI